MKKVKYAFIPISASVFSIIAFFLLTLKIHTTRETDHLGYLILLLILAGQLLIFLNGIIQSSGYIYVPATIIVLLLLYILYIKVCNDF
jgi:hypothetical protein